MIFQSLLLTITVLSIHEADSSDACMETWPTVTKVVNSLGHRLEEIIESNENYFISPFSITVALAMVYIGARGTTKEQMSKVLELNAVGQNCLPNKISEDFRELILSLQNDDEDYSFLIANGAFVQSGYHISQYYSSNLKRFFNSNLKSLNFAKDELATMAAINEWVSNYTKGKIARLLNEPLDPLTIMVLINGVYFKGVWDVEFDEEATRPSYFIGLNDTKNIVQFMEMQEKVYYYFDTETEYSFLELDYKGRNTSMIIILPKNVEVPKYFLTSELLCDLRKNFELRTVSISLPKFNMEFQRELSKDMTNLGMDQLFSDRADLSGIREQNDLHVSLMVHKAVIEVNEKGSEAAAISGIGIDGRQKISQKVLFFANQPFSFYIVHRETNTILFAGRIQNL